MPRTIPFATAVFLLIAVGAGAQALLPSAPAPDPFRLRLDAGGAGAEWSLARGTGRPDIRIADEGGTEVLEMRSSRSSCGLQRKVKVDLGARRFLSWRWRAEVLPEGGDFRSDRANDQAAQLYVAFSPTRAIGYIWDTSAPEGTVGDMPALPFMKVKAIVLRSGAKDLGTWALERRDLRADYERLFGEPMPEARELGLRLWINSQHTGSEAASAFADMRFE